MQDETATNVDAASEVESAQPVETGNATPTSTPAQPSAAGDVLSTLEQRLAELERRPVLSPDEVAKQIFQSKPFKQSQKAVTRALIEEEVERRTAVLNKLAEKTSDPDTLANIEAEKREIAAQVKQEVEQSQQVEEQTYARQPQRPSQDDLTQLWAGKTLSKHGLTWQDVTAEMTDYIQKNRVSTMPEDAFLDLVAEKFKAKNQAKLQAEAVKVVEQRSQQVRAAERQGAGSPPIGGQSVASAQAQLEKLNQQGPPDDPKGAQQYLEKLRKLHAQIDEMEGG